MIKVYSLIHSTITVGREWAQPVKSFDPHLSDKFLNVFFHKLSLTPLGKTAIVIKKKGWELVRTCKNVSLSSFSSSQGTKLTYGRWDRRWIWRRKDFTVPEHGFE